MKLCYTQGVIERDMPAEKLQLPSTDCLVIVGHSIEQVARSWRPTRLVQKLHPDGKRTGLREPRDLTNDDNTLVGGGTAVALGTVEFIEQVTLYSSAPQLLIYAGGRPGYVENNSDETLTEGRVMKEYVDRKTKSTSDIRNIPSTILEKNRTTKDDVWNSLRVAKENGMQNVTFLMLGLRKQRCIAFYQELIRQYPEYLNLKVNFQTVEPILKTRFAKHSKLLSKILGGYLSSKAYEITAQKEKAGIKELKEGRYNGRGNY